MKKTKIAKKEVETKEVKKSVKLMSLSNKIIVSFVALSAVFLMAGFIVQAQLMCKESKFWQQVATYYYKEASKNK